MPRCPPRLKNFSYTGLFTYFFTAVTWHRQTAFLRENFAETCRLQLLQDAAEAGFSVLAYCLMPDHAHLLFRALREDAHALRFFYDWRQGTGDAWKREATTRLWQEGYWDYVLRRDEDPLFLAAYIVQNPVRAGLCTSVDAYRFSGSTCYSSSELSRLLDPDLVRRYRRDNRQG